MDPLDEMRAFWRGKKVLVTGHTGFKGSWLCLWLELLEAEVVGYALDPPTEPNLFGLAEVATGIRSVHGDVRDLDRLAATMRETAAEIVIHMAAQALVRQSYADPVETYSTNVMGTVNLLEAVRRTGQARAVVVVTSDKCYQAQGERRGHVEDDPMGGADPYSSSKGCAELVTTAYQRWLLEGGSDAAPLPAVASARAGNVIGGGDWSADRLIPDFIRAIVAGKPMVIRNPDSIRPWQHVLEPLGGYLLLAELLYRHGREYAEAWNFGPDQEDEVRVQRVVERIIELWGEDASWVLDDRAQPYEAPYIHLDCSKARFRFGWRPRIDVDQALQWIVDWHQMLRAGRPARELCVRQIEDFLNLEDTTEQ